jgi:SAM-dependent methyltransferase
LWGPIALRDMVNIGVGPLYAVLYPPKSTLPGRSTMVQRCTCSYDSVNGGDHPALQGDIAFYFDLARRAGGEALEIGVGTGRVAVELAKAGIHVTGVDLSAAMLAIGGCIGTRGPAAARMRRHARH